MYTVMLSQDEILEALSSLLGESSQSKLASSMFDVAGAVGTQEEVASLR